MSLPMPTLTIPKQAEVDLPLTEKPSLPLPAAIVITVPSSPDDPPNSIKNIPWSPTLRAFELSAPSDMTSRAPFDSSNLSPLSAMSHNVPMSPFQERLAAADLPPPGIEHFAARRALWTLIVHPTRPSPAEPSVSRRRLETLLAQPGALEDDNVWDAGVDRVWRGLINGAKLKHRLPLSLVIKILQAGWIREGTWPRGAIVPDSEEDVPLSDTRGEAALSSPATPTGITTPESVVEASMSKVQGGE